MSKYRKILSFCSNLLFVTFILTFAYIFITTYMGKVPSVFGYHFMRVVSSSMEPVISEGDCIIVKKVEPEDVEEGDIITFYSDDPAIYNYINTHRVVKVEKDEDDKYIYWTKGDNNLGEDYYPAKEDKLIGRYEKEIIFGKVISKGFKLLSDRKIYFCIIVLPILLSLISSIISIIRIIVEKDEDYGGEDKEN